MKDGGMRFLIKEGDKQYRLATGQESHDSVQRRFQRKSNGSIRAVPGFTIERCGKKEDISPKKKTKVREEEKQHRKRQEGESQHMERRSEKV